MKTRSLICFVRRKFLTDNNTLVRFKKVTVDFQSIDETSIRGELVADSFQFGRTVVLESGSILVANSVFLKPNSSVTFSTGSSCRIDFVNVFGTLRMKQNSYLLYKILYIAPFSNLIYESPMQAVIPPEATIALSGAVFALQLTVLGTLSIPSEANASIQIPIISDSNSGCSIKIQGYLTVISTFSVKQCAVSGAGVLRMPNGFVANNSIVVSVSQVEVSGFLVVPTGAQIRFQNSTLKLFSCAANVSGHIFADSKSHFVLSSGSSFISQNAVLSGFGSMTYSGDVSVTSTVVHATTILGTASSSIACISSAFGAEYILNAGLVMFFYNNRKYEIIYSLHIVAGLFTVRNCTVLANKVTFSKSSVISCSDCKAFEVSGLYTLNSSVEVLGVMRVVPALASPPLQISSFYPVIKDNKLSSIQNITGNHAECIEVKHFKSY